jgi:hypothetical protein
VAADKPEARGWRRVLSANSTALVAMVGLIGTILGGVIGAFGTYLSDHALQDQLVREQKASELDSAKTAASFVYVDYTKVQSIVEVMFHETAYDVVEPLPPDLTVAQEAPIAAEVPVGDLVVLDEVDSEIDVLRMTLRGKTNGEPLVPGSAPLLAMTNRDITAALAVLRPLERR